MSGPASDSLVINVADVEEAPVAPTFEKATENATYEGSQSVHDKMADLGGQVRDRFGMEASMMDMFDGHVVYDKSGKCYSIGYKESRGECKLLDEQPQEVRRTTRYEPVTNTDPSRQAAEQYLTANCGCWGKRAVAAIQAVNEGFTDEDRQYRYDPEQGWQVRNLEGAGPDEEEEDDEEDEEEDGDEEDNEEEDEEGKSTEEVTMAANNTNNTPAPATPAVNPEAPAPAPAPAVNQTPSPAVAETPKPLTMDQWLALAPEEGRATWNHLVRVGERFTEVENREKDTVINRLVANLGDEEVRKARAEKLRSKSLEELQEMAELLGPQRRPEGFLMPAYLGQGGAPAANKQGQSVSHAQNATEDDDILPLPTTNWAELAEENRRARQNAR